MGMADIGLWQTGVSIIMPTYNAERFLKETIESVRSQTFENWELIIVDDMSTDSTFKVASEFAREDERIVVHQLEKNSGGPAQPRNKGVGLAKGRWIAFIDSDDLWHPNKLEHQLNALAKGGCSFSCTGLRNFEDSGEIDFFDFSTSPATKITYRRQRLRTAIANSSVLIRRDIAASFPFEEGPEFRAVEDYHCWIRVMRAGYHCLKLDSPYLAYRISDGQISAGKLSQARKVFLVHQSLPVAGPLSFAPSAFFTLTHVLGAILTRMLLGRL